MNKILTHIRTHIISGILTTVPLFLCFLAVLFVYNFVDRRVMAFLGQYFDVRHIPGFGLLLVIVFFYLLGLVAGNIVGSAVLRGIERISARIPLIKHIYSLSKSVGDALVSNPDGVFKKVVFINYPNPNQWTIAFTTGHVKDAGSGEELLKVFVPMAHPVVGVVYLVRESQVKETGWPMDGTIKMLISVGIINPKDLPRRV